MRILQVLPALRQGGVEQGTLEIARALCEQGHQAFVASAGGPMVAKLNAMGAMHFTLPLQRKNPLHMMLNALALSRLIQRHDIHLVHARSRAPAWSAWWAAQRCGTPFITTFHGAYGHQNAAKRWYNRIMCRGQPVIAVSKFIAEHIQHVYGLSSDQIEVIWRGIEMQHFDPAHVSAERVERLRTLWQLQGHREIPLLMLPGRLTRLKGHSLLVEALANLRHLPWHCLITGAVRQNNSGEAYLKELHDAVAAARLMDRVQFTGPCDDMAAAYQFVDVVVSASTKPESFGRTVVEAQAAGCAVVAPNHGGAQEVVADSLALGLFEPNNAVALAQALQRVLELPQQDRQMRCRQAQSFVAARFQLEDMCRRTLAIYQDRILTGS